MPTACSRWWTTLADLSRLRRRGARARAHSGCCGRSSGTSRPGAGGSLQGQGVDRRPLGVGRCTPRDGGGTRARTGARQSGRQRDQVHSGGWGSADRHCRQRARCPHRGREFGARNLQRSTCHGCLSASTGSTPDAPASLAAPGLGLSIVKHLVAKIGGGITVDSGGGWTRFRLLLPRADSPKSDTYVSPS